MLGSCLGVERGQRTWRRPSLDAEPWAATRAGSTGVITRLGLHADVTVESTYAFDSNFGRFEIEDDTRLDPRYSLALGLEHFVLDDVALQAGIAWRVFQPETIGNDIIVFDEVRELEGWVAARWLPPVYAPLRPYVQVGLGILPDVGFEATFDLDGAGTAVEPQRFELDGSIGLSLVASSGLQFQLTDAWFFVLGVLYEENLVPSKDRVTLDVLGTPFVLDTELAPRGWVVFAGLNWYW